MGNVLVFQANEEPDQIIYTPKHLGSAREGSDFPFNEWELEGAIGQCKKISEPG